MRLDLPDAEVRFIPGWLAPDAADALMAALQAGLPWRRHPVRLFGREIPAPRLSCWIGDPDATYRYSGVRHVPEPWHSDLLRLRARLESELQVAFDSVLANLYRDGADAMGWHADDEAELGPAPVIAAVSLGATRRFALRHRQSGVRQDLDLPAGSLLVMAGPTQRAWRHALPRTRRPVGPRISLTFRRVRPA